MRSTKLESAQNLPEHAPGPGIEGKDFFRLVKNPEYNQKRFFSRVGKIQCQIKYAKNLPSF